jgi:hypothetical protein
METNNGHSGDTTGHTHYQDNEENKYTMSLEDFQGERKQEALGYVIDYVDLA